MKQHEVLIMGGGPGGSTLAALLAKQNVDVAVFEREAYPRFHIGESLLPATMPLFQETGFYDTLASGKYIPKYGAMFVDYNSDDEIYFGFQNGFNQDIPSAFEVERCEFDKDILNHARKCGAVVYQPERVRSVEFVNNHGVVKTHEGEYEGRFVIDATGRDSFLGKQNTKRDVNKDLNNVAVFAHFVNVKRYEGIHEGDITIGLMPEGAWSWIIPFKGERTSVGIVCHASVFRGQANLAKYMDTVLCSSPRVRDMMQHAERCTEVTTIANYSHTSSCYGGDRWLLVGDAAVFLDPIFSSGVHISCTSAKLASELILASLQKNQGFSATDLNQYKADFDKGVKRFHSMIARFYDDNFVQSMKKTITLEHVRKAFISAVAGDMWNDDNLLFQRGVL